MNRLWAALLVASSMFMVGCDSGGDVGPNENASAPTADQMKAQEDMGKKYAEQMQATQSQR